MKLGNRLKASLTPLIAATSLVGCVSSQPKVSSHEARSFYGNMLKQSCGVDVHPSVYRACIKNRLFVLNQLIDLEQDPKRKHSLIAKREALMPTIQMVKQIEKEEADKEEIRQQLEAILSEDALTNR